MAKHGECFLGFYLIFSRCTLKNLEIKQIAENILRSSEQHRLASSVRVTRQGSSLSISQVIRGNPMCLEVQSQGVVWVNTDSQMSAGIC